MHSDAYAAGELKHGTISLVTDGVPVIALATQKNVYEKTISNAKETRSRGARVLLFTTKDAEVPEGVATEVIRLDEYDDILMPSAHRAAAIVRLLYGGAAWLRRG